MSELPDSAPAQEPIPSDPKEIFLYDITSADDARSQELFDVAASDPEQLQSLIMKAQEDLGTTGAELVKGFKRDHEEAAYKAAKEQYATLMGLVGARLLEERTAVDEISTGAASEELVDMLIESSKSVDVEQRDHRLETSIVDRVAEKLGSRRRAKIMGIITLGLLGAGGALLASKGFEWSTETLKEYMELEATGAGVFSGTGAVVASAVEHAAKIGSGRLVSGPKERIEDWELAEPEKDDDDEESDEEKTADKDDVFDTADMTREPVEQEPTSEKIEGHNEVLEGKLFAITSRNRLNEVNKQGELVTSRALAKRLAEVTADSFDTIFGMEKDNGTEVSSAFINGAVEGIVGLKDMSDTLDEVGGKSASKVEHGIKHGVHSIFTRYRRIRGRNK